jgi:hypothetical protein
MVFATSFCGSAKAMQVVKHGCDGQCPSLHNFFGDLIFPIVSDNLITILNSEYLYQQKKGARIQFPTNVKHFL